MKLCVALVAGLVVVLVGGCTDDPRSTHAGSSAGTSSPSAAASASPSTVITTLTPADYSIRLDGLEPPGGEQPIITAAAAAAAAAAAVCSPSDPACDHHAPDRITLARLNDVYGAQSGKLVWVVERDDVTACVFSHPVGPSNIPGPEQRPPISCDWYELVDADTGVTLGTSETGN